MPRNPSGDAGPDVVPPSTSTSSGGGAARAGGPKRPPRPKAKSPDGPNRSNRTKKAPASNGTTAPAKAAKGAKKPASPADDPTNPVGMPPPGFAGSNPSMPAVADPTVVEPRPATAPAAKAPRSRSRATTEPVIERTTGNRRGRRVTRVVRRIEIWSVLKLSLVLFTCLYLAVMGTLVVVWGVAYSSGQVERLQEFLADVGLENFRFYGDRMFKAVAAIGAVFVLAGTILAVLTTALINVISEMTGGIRVVVIEEERPTRR